jgi:hypothetical protein
MSLFDLNVEIFLADGYKVFNYRICYWLRDLNPFLMLFFIFVESNDVNFSRVYILLRSDKLHFKHNYFLFRNKVEVKLGNLKFLCVVAKPEYSPRKLSFNVFLYPCTINLGAFIVFTIYSV